MLASAGACRGQSINSLSGAITPQSAESRGQQGPQETYVFGPATADVQPSSGARAGSLAEAPCADSQRCAEEAFITGLAAQRKRRRSGSATASGFRVRAGN